MKTRILTGVVGIAFLAGVLVGSWYWPWTFYIAVAIICAVSASEMLTATGLGKHKVLSVGAILFAAFVPFSVHVAGLTPYPVVQAVFFAYCMFLFSHAIFHHRDVAFPDLAVVFVGSVAVPYALSTMAYVQDTGGVHGVYYIILILIGAWASDIGAYFTGSFFGKHKLAPEISPKKTVEGFLGGIVVCIAAVVLSVAAYQAWFSPVEFTASYPAAILLAALCSFISVLGDLTFSVVKRSYQIKDFGNVFPGHGGMLDRFDSVVFVAPLVYLMIQFVPVILP